MYFEVGFQVCFLFFGISSIMVTYGSLLDNLLEPTTTPAPRMIPQSCNSRLSSTQLPPNNNLPLCVLSVEDIASGRLLNGTIVQLSPIPYWFNSSLATIGQSFALKNKFSITLGALAGLLAGLPIPDARDVLSFTGNSDTTDTAARRYLATATQMYVWLDEILNTELNEIFFTSIAHVREMHLNVVNKINSSVGGKPLYDPKEYVDVTTDELMWTAIASDLASSSLNIPRDYSTNYTKYDSTAVPINQFMQSLTLFAFAGYTVMDPESVLIHDATAEELTGWMHLWAILGYVLGIDDNYNVMLQPDVTTARHYFNDINNKYMIPSYFKVEKVGKVLVESMLKAANQYVPAVGTRPIMYRLLRDYFKISAPAMLKLINSELSDYTAQLNWDTVIAPSTALADERLILNTGLSTDVQVLVIEYFGSYVTNVDKANHVYYPGLSA